MGRPTAVVENAMSTLTGQLSENNPNMMLPHVDGNMISPPTRILRPMNSFFLFRREQHVRLQAMSTRLSTTKVF